MKKSTTVNSNKIDDALKTLTEVLQYDQEVQARVIQLMQLESSERRTVLNNWLNHLQNKQAPQEMITALTCLFDDVAVKKIMKLLS